MKTKLGFIPDPSCEVLCIAPENTEFSASAPVADAVRWSTDVDPSIVVTKVAGSAALSATVADGKLVVSGTSTKAECLVLSATNKCGTATWVVNVPATCILPCPAAAVALSADETGEVIATIDLVAPASEITATTGLGSAEAKLQGKTLSIIGKVDAGSWTVTLASPCGPCTVLGTATVPALPPPCEPLRLVRTTGSFNTVIGQAVDACYFFAGTAPAVVVDFSGLPAGLNVSAVVVGAETKVCVTGTVVEDKCAPEAGCKTGKVTIKNCAGSLDFNPKFYVEATPPPRPPYCAGLVSVKDSTTAAPPGYRCFDLTASYFLPDTTLYISTLGADGSGSDSSFTPNDSGQVVAGAGELAVVLDSSGGATKKICVLTSGSGCFTAALYARHDTCGVISTMAAISAPLALLNDCFDTGGAGGI